MINYQPRNENLIKLLIHNVKCVTYVREAGGTNDERKLKKPLNHFHALGMTSLPNTLSHSMNVIKGRARALISHTGIV